MRRIAIPRLDRRHDRIVLGKRGRPPSRRGKRRGGQQRHGAVHKVELLNQITVVRGQMDLPVEPPVRPAQCIGVADQRPIGRHHLTQHPHLLVGRVPGRQPGRQPLQLRAHHVELRHLVAVERRHDQAAPVPAQHALRLEPLQRLADRGARNAELVGQLGFDQPGARPIGAPIDRIQDQRVRVARRGFADIHGRGPFGGHDSA